MADIKSIVHYQTAEYGGIKGKLAQALDSRGITRNHLRKLTGLKYDVITRYYRADHIEMIDLDFFAKVCFVLNCEISELLEYQPPEQ